MTALPSLPGLSEGPPGGDAVPAGTSADAPSSPAIPVFPAHLHHPSSLISSAPACRCLEKAPRDGLPLGPLQGCAVAQICSSPAGNMLPAAARLRPGHYASLIVMGDSFKFFALEWPPSEKNQRAESVREKQKARAGTTPFGVGSCARFLFLSLSDGFFMTFPIGETDFVVVAALALAGIAGPLAVAKAFPSCWAGCQLCRDGGVVGVEPAPKFIQ